tara:strand:+ start:2411 stop:2758 length:348 start_codon:yes stop_codon:yes gene_type:complete
MQTEITVIDNLARCSLLAETMDDTLTLRRMHNSLGREPNLAESENLTRLDILSSVGDTVTPLPEHRRPTHIGPEQGLPGTGMGCVWCGSYLHFGEGWRTMRCEKCLHLYVNEAKT